MASPASITRANPDTLPADFGEWDAQPIPAVLPEDFNEFDGEPLCHADGGGEKLDKTADDEKAANSDLASPSVSVQATKPDHAQIESPNIETPKENEVSSETSPHERSRLKVLTITSSVILLLLLLVSLLYARREFAAVKPHAATGHQQYEPQPSPAQPAESSPAPTKPSPSVPAVAAPSEQVAPVPDQSSRSDQASLMDAQLNAPARIPKALKSASTQEAPDLTTVGMDGIGGAESIGGVFGTNKRPVVKAESKPIAISAGVAEGRLIHRMPPVYPQIARSARVSGTVILSATISKAGLPEGVHVISGPEMLRRAAIDAVKTWRYKPYLLNNEPVQVETTINVIFTIN